MKLTRMDDRNALQRYASIKPAKASRDRACSTALPGSGRVCTRPAGHGGPHVAHDLLRRVVAVWDSGSSGDAGARSAPAPTRSRGGPIGLPSRSPVGLMEGVRGLVRRAIDSPDQIVFAILFVVFVKLAIDVLMTLR